MRIVYLIMVNEWRMRQAKLARNKAAKALERSILADKLARETNAKLIDYAHTRQLEVSHA